MDSLNSVGASGAQPPRAHLAPAQPRSADADAASYAAGSGAMSQSVSVQSSMTSVTEVTAHIQTLMASLDAKLENDPLLRMIMSLLILQLLLGAEREGGSGGNRFDALGQLMEWSESSRVTFMQSSTTVYRLDYASTEVTAAITESSSAAEGGGGQPGGQIDLTA
jgi:hypothetical protein